MGQEEEKQREWSHPERGQGDGSSQNEIPLRCSTKKLAIGTGGGDMEIKERRQAYREAELFFQSEQVRAKVSVSSWRVYSVAPGTSGCAGLEGERAFSVANFLALVLPLQFQIGTVCIGSYS